MSGRELEPILSEELYRRFLKRDRDALAALVDLYRTELTAYIRRIVGNPDDAEELMVDAFVKLMRSKAVFTDSAALKAYLFKIGKNSALRHLAKSDRDRRTVELTESLLESEDRDAQPEAAVLRAEQSRLLDEVVDQLRPEYRQVLRLLFFENMSYADAGLVMNKTVRQVDGLVYRAKATLRKKLEKEGFIYAYETE